MTKSSVVCPNCHEDLPYYANGKAMTLICWNCRIDVTVLAKMAGEEPLAIIPYYCYESATVEYNYEPSYDDYFDDSVVDTPAVTLESLITKDLANGMTQCGAHLEHSNTKEKDCKWYRSSSTSNRCMYWREACECCDKVVVDDKEIN